MRFSVDDPLCPFNDPTLSDVERVRAGLRVVAENLRFLTEGRVVAENLRFLTGGVQQQLMLLQKLGVAMENLAPRRSERPARSVAIGDELVWRTGQRPRRLEVDHDANDRGHVLSLVRDNGGLPRALLVLRWPLLAVVRAIEWAAVRAWWARR